MACDLMTSLDQFHSLVHKCQNRRSKEGGEEFEKEMIRTAAAFEKFLNDNNGKFVAGTVVLVIMAIIDTLIDSAKTSGMELDPVQLDPNAASNSNGETFIGDGAITQQFEVGGRLGLRIDADSIENGLLSLLQRVVENTKENDPGLLKRVFEKVGVKQ